MKVHLIKKSQESIRGYTQITYDPSTSGNIKLQNLLALSDNECDFILANEVLDDFSIQEIKECITNIVKKLRLGGTLVVGGTDINLFCKNVLSSMIKDNDASEMIRSKQSMTTLNGVLTLLKYFNLKIKTTQINGTHYEITCVRDKN